MDQVRTLSPEAAFGLLGGARCTRGGGVRRVAVSPAARAHGTLSHVDYADAFLVEVNSPDGRTAEEWARAILEGAPSPMERVVLGLLSIIGLQLGPTPADGFVAGWEVRRSTPELALLGAIAPRIGLSAELLFERQQHALLWTTFVQLQKPIGRAVWAGLAPVHRQVVRYLLGQVGAESERGGARE
jgi:hypothetical protein